MLRLNFFGNPYGWKETVNWIAKHLIIEIEIPLTLLVLVLLLTPMKIIPQWGIILLTIFAIIFVIIYFYFFNLRKENKVENLKPNGEIIKTTNSKGETIDGWWQSEIDGVKLENPYKIGFVGDIMKLRNYTLKFDDSIKHFFEDANLIVGNLEGIITESNWLGLSAQKHSENILLEGINKCLPAPNLTEDISAQTKAIKDIKEPKNWLLCLSNNHGADYGRDEFQKCNKIIKDMKDQGFNVFGNMKNQSFPYGRQKEINLVCGTMWNNQRKHCYVAQFDFIDENYEERKFNILYPHWHYENEPYVRKSIREKSNNLIQIGEYISNRKRERLVRKKYKFKKGIWDLIVGHHSHVPQPIELIQSGENKEDKNKDDIPKILAYSCGNFTSSQWRKKHRSGLVLIIYIGTLKNTDKHKLAVGKIQWCYTVNERSWWKKEVTVIIDKHRTKANNYSKPPKRWLMNLFVASFFTLFLILIICGIATGNNLFLLIYILNALTILIFYFLFLLLRSLRKYGS